MEKYLVFLIAWFGNKFIKHIKMPQGLENCSVSEQPHLPWPHSCRIRKDCLLLQPQEYHTWHLFSTCSVNSSRTTNQESLQPEQSSRFRHLHYSLSPLSSSASMKGSPVGALPARVRNIPQESSRILRHIGQLKKKKFHGSCKEQFWFLSYSKYC